MSPSPSSGRWRIGPPRWLQRLGIVAALAVIVLLVGMGLADKHNDSESLLLGRFDARVASAETFTSSYAAGLLADESRTAGQLMTGNAAGLQDELEQVALTLDSPAAVVLDSNGSLLAVVPYSAGLIGSRLTDRYAHLASAAQGRPAISNTVPSAVTGAPVVAFATPYESSGARRVISLAYEVGKTPLGTYLTNTLPLPGAQIDLVDASGGIVYSSATTAADNRGSALAKADPQLVQAFSQGSTGFYTPSDGGEPRYFSQLPVTGTPWRVIGSVPEGPYLAPVRGNQAREWTLFAVFGLVCVALAAAGIALMARRDQLRRTNELLTQTTSGAPIGQATISPEGVFLTANPAYCDVTGYPEHELVGKTFQQITHPDDLDLDLGELDKLSRGLIQSYTIDKRYIRKDHTAIWLRLHASAIRDDTGTPLSYVAQVVDIDSQKHAEAALVASEQAYRLIADNAGDMVMRVKDGKWEWLSPSVSVVLGWAPVSMLGSPTTETTHPDDQDIIEKARSDVAAGRDVLIRKRLRSKHRGWIWTEAHESPYLNDRGEVDGMVIMARDITDQVAAERAAEEALSDLAYRSSHDLLTGLRNRAELVAFLERCLRDQPHDSVAVLFIDVDRFKHINDGMSHAAGDTILTELAQRLRDCCRSTDLVGRLGGDEFALVLTTVTDAGDVRGAAERIRQAISGQRFNVAGQRVGVTISIGAAIGTGHSTAASLLSEADTALYAAKASGRNRWEIADEALRLEAVRRLHMTTQIRDGLDNGEFHAWLQPIIDLRSGAIIGYEALARWVSGSGEVKPAAEFIEIAESSGLIRGVGSAVIREAIAAIPGLPNGQTVSINASPAQLSAPNFAAEISGWLEVSNASPTQLVIEITEQGLLDLDGSSRKGLLQLRADGVGIHIDDFGTGFSSLSTLRDYPITGIKLDRTFTAQLPAPPESLVFGIIAGISDLAGRLNLDQIAEGVETAEQARTLQAMGWTSAQGWLYGPAQPPAHYPPSLGRLQTALRATSCDDARRISHSK